MPNGSIERHHNYVAELAAAHQKQWPTISAAEADATRVHQLLCERLRQFRSDDVDLVVFGSLARGEWTTGSDVDWTMLIDGQANADHRTIARDVETSLGELEYNGTKLKPPGSQGVFGNMAFSHEIIHHIGGQADSNRNTTQRILLLLEAKAVRPLDKDRDGPFERMLRQILNRYLLSDSNFHSQADKQSRIPRFLLNDVVRYWRTMCVDFAYKDWEQAGKKWALRNIKLRTSRKLLFVSGLFTVFSCFENEALQRVEGEDNYLLRLQGHLLEYVHSTPLNIIAWSLKDIGLDEEAATLIDHYERFLSYVNDAAVREHLAALSEDDVYADDQFLKCRAISHKLQAVLKQMCFENSFTTTRLHDGIRSVLNENWIFNWQHCD